MCITGAGTDDEPTEFSLALASNADFKSHCLCCCVLISELWIIVQRPQRLSNSLPLLLHKSFLLSATRLKIATIHLEGLGRMQELGANFLLSLSSIFPYSYMELCVPGAPAGNHRATRAT